MQNKDGAIYSLENEIFKHCLTYKHLLTIETNSEKSEDAAGYLEPQEGAQVRIQGGIRY